MKRFLFQNILAVSAIYNVYTLYFWICTFCVLNLQNIFVNKIERISRFLMVEWKLIKVLGNIKSCKIMDEISGMEGWLMIINDLYWKPHPKTLTVLSWLKSSKRQLSWLLKWDILSCLPSRVQKELLPKIEIEINFEKQQNQLLELKVLTRLVKVNMIFLWHASDKRQTSCMPVFV